MKVRGQWKYLYRAVYKDGKTIVFCSESGGLVLEDAGVNSVDATRKGWVVARRSKAAYRSRLTQIGVSRSLFLHAGPEVTRTTAVSAEGAHKAAEIVTAYNWSAEAPDVKFAPTFSRLPKELQDSVEKNQQGKTKGVFHAAFIPRSLVCNIAMGLTKRPVHTSHRNPVYRVCRLVDFLYLSCKISVVP